jgi:hypothetical protein
MLLIITAFSNLRFMGMHHETGNLQEMEKVFTLLNQTVPKIKIYKFNAGSEIM